MCAWLCNGKFMCKHNWVWQYDMDGVTLGFMHFHKYAIKFI